MTDSLEAEDRLSLARKAAKEGATIAMEGFRTNTDVETKAGPLDVVTDLDRAVQRRVVAVLREDDPDVTVVGEEDLPDVDTASTVPETGRCWVVDPIDGTNNFVAGNRAWGVSIAAMVDAEPVAAVNRFPALGDVYEVAVDEPTRDGEPCSVSARTDPGTFTIAPVFGVAPAHQRKLPDYVDVITERFGDVRRFGCAQLTLSAVAAGELEAAVSAARLEPWDTVAGVHLVRQAGGTVTDAHGDRWSPGCEGLVASNGVAHDTLVESFDAE